MLEPLLPPVNLPCVPLEVLLPLTLDLPLLSVPELLDELPPEPSVPELLSAPLLLPLLPELLAEPVKAPPEEPPEPPSAPPLLALPPLLSIAAPPATPPPTACANDAHGIDMAAANTDAVRKVANRFMITSPSFRSPRTKTEASEHSIEVVPDGNASPIQTGRVLSIMTGHWFR